MRERGETPSSVWRHSWCVATGVVSNWFRHSSELTSVWVTCQKKVVKHDTQVESSRKKRRKTTKLTLFLFLLSSILLSSTKTHTHTHKQQQRQHMLCV